MFKMPAQAALVLKGHPAADREKLALEFVQHPMTYHCPNGPGEKYINTIVKAMRESKIPLVKCSYANGVGKTWETLNILANFIYGPQNGWFDFLEFRRYPFPKTIWYCSKAENIADVVVPAFRSIVRPEFNPQFEYSESKENKRIVSRITCGNGWAIQLKTYDQDPATFESQTVGLIVCDEPAPELIWRALKSRRRMGCLTLMPMTQLYAPPYIIDEIEKAVQEGRPGQYNLEASLYEACSKRGVRGHLDPDIVDQMVADYSEEEREARVYGRAMYFSGRIWENLDPSRHLQTPETWPIPPHSRIVQVVDPHDSRPAAGIWGAICPDGHKIVIGEYPFVQDRPYWEMKRGKTVEAEAKEWLDYEAKQNWKISRRVMDKYFGWQTRGQKTFADLYLEAGKSLGRQIIFDPSYTAGANEDGEVAYGNRVVRSMLDPMADGYPELMIYRDCYHTWNGMTHYIREHVTGKAADFKHATDGRIIKKYEDFAAVVRYFACIDIVATVPKPPKTASEKLILRATRRTSTSQYS